MRVKLGKRMHKLHKPSIYGKGKWENLMTFTKYKLKRRKAKRVSKHSRKINRLS